jgi:outer membrane protein
LYTNFMKNNGKLSVILATLALIGVGIIGAVQWKKKEKVAYIDNNELVLKYQGMIDARKQLETKNKILQGNIDTLASEFQTELKKYERERAKMSDKERKLAEELLNNKQQQAINYRDAIQKKAKEEESKLTMEVLGRLNEQIKAYGKAQGYTFIFGATNVGNIIYADKVNDITEEILTEVNKAYTGK